MKTLKRTLTLAIVTVCANLWTANAQRLASPSLRIDPDPGLQPASPAQAAVPNLGLATPNAMGRGVGPNLRIIARNGNDSEIAVAASRNGRNVVVAANANAVVASQDAGATWSAPVSWPSGAAGGTTQGDPALGIGLSGNVYLAYIWNNPAPSCDFGLAISTMMGANFTGPISAVSCPPSANGCFPDQETMAVDQVNPGAGGGDQIYLSWRQFTDIGCPQNGPGNEDAMICCSQASGAAGTWTAPVLVDAAGDRPRPAVAPDGSVYVVYLADPGDGAAVRVHRFTSCRMGLTPIAGYPYAVAPSSTVTGVPGLDRQGQEGSPMIGVDPYNSGLVYVVYGLNSSALSSSGDPDILLRISNNGGVNWSAPIRINDNVANNTSRYFPWLAVNPADGSVVIAWYDRRDDPANNDLTAYFGARVTGGGTTTVTVHPNFRISQVDYSAAANIGPITAPKWGDYNGLAVGPNFMYAAWASSVSPPGIQPASSSIDVFFASIVAGGIPQVRPSGLLDFGNVCVGANSVLELTLCNAGKADLIVTSVSSSDSEFAVEPISFPLVISPDACFPIRVRFAPISDGPKSATLTITNNDPVNPRLVLQATGTGVRQRISTFIADAGNFGNVCLGSYKDLDLTINNSGKCDLTVNDIISTSTQFLPPAGVSYPLVVHPGDSIHVPIRFEPTTLGLKLGIISVASDDPAVPNRVTPVSGNAPSATIATAIPDNGNYGDVCIGSFKDLGVLINNTGGCDLRINNITSSDPQFGPPSVMTFPLIVHPGGVLKIPIRFQPVLPFGPKSATITFASNDPVTPAKAISLTGNAPSGDVRVIGSTDFGDACSGTLAEKTIRICNVGLCDLRVTSVAFVLPCPDFTLINNPFPATISHGSCLDVVIRFTPTSCGPKTCNLRIVSDDPETPAINLTVTANSPCVIIDVPPDLGFAPEVVQTVGDCKSSLPFPISNNSECNLTITSIVLGGPNVGDFALSGLPSFPIILEPGHIVGEGDLNVVFAPTQVDRDREATITVTYVSDSVSGVTTSVTRKLCGEGVRTGARVLVTKGGIPVAKVEKIHLQRINANRNRPRLDTQDQVMNVALVTVVPMAPCEPFQYHREYGTVSNPIQLLPGSYQVTATAIINGKRKTLVVGFDVQTCDFNPTVVVDF